VLSNDRVLFIGDDSQWSAMAAAQLKRCYKNIETIFWDFNNTPPTKHLTWQGDRIFTFKADLILPSQTIKSARKSAINFHPSIPRYRGVGGYYYALADKRNEFGVTCHHLDEKIDHGDIIAVDRFPIYYNESVDSLFDRTAHVCLGMFYRILEQLITEQAELGLAENEQWGSKLYTREELTTIEKRYRAEHVSDHYWIERNSA